MMKHGVLAVVDLKDDASHMDLGPDLWWPALRQNQIYGVGL